MYKELNDIFDMAERHTLIEYMVHAPHEENVEIVGIIFSSLVGTCLNTMDSVLDGYGLSIGALMYLGFTEMEVCEILDENALVCDECGWWESPDMMEDGVCSECREDRDDDD